MRVLASPLRWADLSQQLGFRSSNLVPTPTETRGVPFFWDTQRFLARARLGLTPLGMVRGSRSTFREASPRLSALFRRLANHCDLSSHSDYDADVVRSASWSTAFEPFGVHTRPARYQIVGKLTGAHQDPAIAGSY